jgi:hypothetical protein
MGLVLGTEQELDIPRMEEIGAFLKESLQSIFTVAGQVTNTGF